MKSTEDRISELEQRIAKLESIIKESGIEKSENRKIETVPAVSSYKVVNETAQMKPVRQQEEQKPGGKKENKEALVGKYLIGTLAAMLIFIAAISFIRLVWNQMTPGLKLSIIALSGIVLTGIGFYLIRTKKNPITSIILGTGAGLLFIAILSANLAFHLIGNHMSIFLAGVWAIFFIISSRYTNLFFTTIIAYIGSYIALLLGLVLIQNDLELLIMILFISSISLVMIYKTYKSNEVEQITGIMLSLLSYITILSRCFMDGIFGTAQRLDHYFVQIAVLIIIYLMINLLYRVLNKRKTIPIYLIISMLTMLLTIIELIYLNFNYLDLRYLDYYVIFIVPNLVQFILNYIFYKNLENYLTRYYVIVLAFTTALINIELYDMPTGIVLAGLLLVISEKVFKRENKSLLISIVIFLDSFFLIFSESDCLVSTFYGIIQLALLIYLLWENSKAKRYDQTNALKSIGIVVVVINGFGIPANIFNYINFANISEYLGSAIGCLIAVATMITLIKIGYFKNWKNDHFKFPGIHNDLEDDKNMESLIYIISTVLYFYGLQGILAADQLIIQMLFMLATIAAALIQTQSLLSGGKHNRSMVGLWMVLKYFMLTWVILRAFSDLKLISVVYSIAGLIVAIGSILIGFKIKNKGIRQYGLVLTIIMAAKFILVDLHQENSITKVLALIAGGILCFLISLIYNRLSKNYS